MMMAHGIRLAAARDCKLGAVTLATLHSPVRRTPPDSQVSRRLARQCAGNIRRHQDQGGQRRKPGKANIQADEPACICGSKSAGRTQVSGRNWTAEERLLASHSSTSDVRASPVLLLGRKKSAQPVAQATSGKANA